MEDSSASPRRFSAVRATRSCSRSQSVVFSCCSGCDGSVLPRKVAPGFWPAALIPWVAPTVVSALTSSDLRRVAASDSTREVLGVIPGNRLAVRAVDAGVVTASTSGAASLSSDLVPLRADGDPCRAVRGRGGRGAGSVQLFPARHAARLKNSHHLSCCCRRSDVHVSRSSISSRGRPGGFPLYADADLRDVAFRSPAARERRRALYQPPRSSDEIVGSAGHARARSMNPGGRCLSRSSCCRTRCSSCSSSRPFPFYWIRSTSLKS